MLKLLRPVIRRKRFLLSPSHTFGYKKCLFFETVLDVGIVKMVAFVEVNTRINFNYVPCTYDVLFILPTYLLYLPSSLGGLRSQQNAALSVA
jgi:hypothetical protein